MTRYLFCATALAALPTAALAGEPLLLDEIVVSGGRTPIGAQAYGRANSVVTAEQIEERQLTEVSEVLRALPGVSVSRTGGPGGATEVRLRGAESNQVLVLIDGIEVAGPETGTYDFGGLLAADIARVEVLRGPQSSLYGANATAGVISIITRRGARDSFHYGGSIEGGTDETANIEGYLRGGGKNYDASLSLVRRRAGGFDVSDSPHGHPDRDRNVTFNAKGNVDVSEDFSLGATFRYTDRKSDFDGFAYGAATKAGLVYDENNFLKQRAVSASVHSKLKAFGGRVEHLARFDVADITSLNFTDATRDANVHSDRLRGSYQATVALDAPDVEQANHTLTLAGEWKRETFRNVEADLVFDPSQLNEEQRNLFGLTAEYRGNLFDALDVQIGLRHDVNDDFKDTTTFSAGLSYRLKQTDTRLHASIGTGVTNPTFYEQFGFIPATFIGNPDLKPEENFGWDVGVEQSFLNGRAVIDITFFQERLKNEITTVFLPPDYLSMPVNFDGTSHRHGIEVTASYTPIDKLTFDVSYTWVDAHDANNQIEVRRPRHEGRLGARYSFLGGDAAISASARFVAGNHDFDYTAASYGADVVRLGDYVVVDIAGSYKVNDRIELTARVDNLTDTHYEELYGYASAGITAYAGVRVRF